MPADTPLLLLAGGSIFDSEARSFRTGLDVLCRDGVVTALAPSGSIAAAGARVLDCRGRFILPGFVDCHVHLTSSGDPGELNRGASEPPGLTALRASVNARRTLESGFTTVRDLGAAGQVNVHLARAIDEGVVPGPRVLAAGLGVTMTGGHGHGFIAREADGPDEVRKAVREQLRAGATAVKLFASGGVMTAGVDPRSASFTVEEMTAAVDEAHKAFRTVAAHAQATAGIRNAVVAGVDSIEHGVWLDDETVGMMVERGTYLVPTLTAPEVMVEGGEASGIPPYMVAKSRQVHEDHIASYQLALRAGVRVAMGTDQGTPLSRPGENAQEVLRMAKRGLSDAAAILAATAWAADLLQVPAGRVEEGKLADLVVLPADPLADLSIVARPGAFTAVIKAGVPVVQRTAVEGVRDE